MKARYPQVRIGSKTYNKHHHSKPIHTGKTDREYIKFRAQVRRGMAKFKRRITGRKM